MIINRELGEEVRTSRKKVERRKQAESNWQTLLVNPSRFSQVRCLTIYRSIVMMMLL